MPRFDYLLFDLDNTLLDFSSTAQRALESVFSDWCLPLTPEVHTTYTEINHEVWTAFESGLMTAETLRVERFERLFKALGKSPVAPALASQQYLTQLVQQSTAYNGVPELLTRLGQTYRLGIITNGLREVQRPRLKLLNLIHHFSTIVVSDEIGVAKPDHAFFAYTFENLSVNTSPERSLVIGDNLASDIKGGNNFGCPTCWISHGRTNTGTIMPNLMINNVLELENILKTL